MQRKSIASSRMAVKTGSIPCVEPQKTSLLIKPFINGDTLNNALGSRSLTIVGRDNSHGKWQHLVGDDTWKDIALDPLDIDTGVRLR